MSRTIDILSLNYRHFVPNYRHFVHGRTREALKIKAFRGVKKYVSLICIYMTYIGRAGLLDSRRPLFYFRIEAADFFFYRQKIEGHGCPRGTQAARQRCDRQGKTRANICERGTRCGSPAAENKDPPPAKPNRHGRQTVGNGPVYTRPAVLKIKGGIGGKVAAGTHSRYRTRHGLPLHLLKRPLACRCRGDRPRPSGHGQKNILPYPP